MTKRFAFTFAVLTTLLISKISFSQQVKNFRLANFAYPYVVQLAPEDDMRCTGFILDSAPNVVFTAGHCTGGTVLSDHPDPERVKGADQIISMGLKGLESSYSVVHPEKVLRGQLGIKSPKFSESIFTHDLAAYVFPENINLMEEIQNHIRSFHLGAQLEQLYFSQILTRATQRPKPSDLAYSFGYSGYAITNVEVEPNELEKIFGMKKKFVAEGVGAESKRVVEEKLVDQRKFDRYMRPLRAEADNLHCEDLDFKEGVQKKYNLQCESTDYFVLDLKTPELTKRYCSRYEDFVSSHILQIGVSLLPGTYDFPCVGTELHFYNQPKPWAPFVDSTCAEFKAAHPELKDHPCVDRSTAVIDYFPLTADQPLPADLCNALQTDLNNQDFKTRCKEVPSKGEGAWVVEAISPFWEKVPEKLPPDPVHRDISELPKAQGLTSVMFGNSGGPLVIPRNGKYEVVGVNSSLLVMDKTSRNPRVYNFFTDLTYPSNAHFLDCVTAHHADQKALKKCLLEGLDIQP